MAAAVEAYSEHPLGRAITSKAEEDGLPVAEAEGFQAMAGRGVLATVEDRKIAVGGPSLLREEGVDLPDELAARAKEWEERGAGVLHGIENGSFSGSIALEDEIRPESADTVRALHARDISVVMITGDSQAVADHVAEELHIDEVFAEVLPEDKDARVAKLQDGGRIVAMVGDGVNDAPALARADVAMESAGVVLASSDPRTTLAVIELSEASYTKMRQNLWWAAGYNIVALPLAAGVLAPIGYVLPPAVGAALMSLSTIVVAANAQLLRRLDLRPETNAPGH